MILDSTGDTNLRSLRIFSIAMICGVLLFAIVVIAVHEFESMTIEELQPYSMYIPWICAGFALICYLLARFTYNKKIQAIRSSSLTVKEKLNQYRAALIAYMALCEVPAILATIFLMLTGDYRLGGIVLAMLAAMGAKFPLKQRVINELGLDWQEQEALQ